MTSYDLAAVLVVLVVGSTVPLALRQLLGRHNILDLPSSRSAHHQPTLRGGGIAPLMALVASIPFLIIAEDRTLTIAAFATAACAGILGFADDILGLSAHLRLLIQGATGGAAGLVLVALTDASQWWILVITVGLVGYMNAANFMDGVDMISSLHGLVGGLALAYLGLTYEFPWLVIGGAAVAVAFTSFLPWNVYGSKMFLGDVGSYLLGTVLAMLVAGAILEGVPPMAAVAPFAIYCADTSVTFTQRALRRERVLAAHRSHRYQRLNDTGWSHLRVAFVVTAFSLAAAAAGFISLVPSGGWYSLMAVVAVALAYLATTRVATRSSTLPRALRGNNAQPVPPDHH